MPRNKKRKATSALKKNVDIKRSKLIPPVDHQQTTSSNDSSQLMMPNYSFHDDNALVPEHPSTISEDLYVVNHMNDSYDNIGCPFYTANHRPISDRTPNDKAAEGYDEWSTDNAARWAQSPLRSKQSTVQGDAIFGQCPPTINMIQCFGRDNCRWKFLAEGRRETGDWSRDQPNEIELEAYRKGIAYDGRSAVEYFVCRLHDTLCSIWNRSNVLTQWLIDCFRGDFSCCLHGV